MVSLSQPSLQAGHTVPPLPPPPCIQLEFDASLRIGKSLRNCLLATPFQPNRSRADCTGLLVYVLPENELIITPVSLCHDTMRLRPEVTAVLRGVRWEVLVRLEDRDPFSTETLKLCSWRCNFFREGASSRVLRSDRLCRHGNY